MQSTMYQSMYEPGEPQPHNQLRIDDDRDICITFEEPDGRGTMQVVMSAAQFRAFAGRVTRTLEELG